MKIEPTARVVLVDPGFSSERLGHHYKLNRGYAELIGPERCWFAVHQSLRSAPGLPPDRLIRQFALSHYEAAEIDRLGRLGRLLQGLAYQDYTYVPHQLRRLLQAALRRRRQRAIPGSALPEAPVESLYLSDLEGLLARMNLARDDHLVFTSLDTQMGRSLLELIASRGLADLPRMHLRLMYDDATHSDGGLDYQGLLERLRATGLIGPRLSLYSETETHARAIRKTFGIPVGLAPFPAGGLPPPDDPSNRRVVVSYLGEARREKGFDMIEPAIRAFENRYPELADRVAWRIHAGGDTIEAAGLRDQLRAKPLRTGMDVKFQFGSLSPEAYERARCEADIVLALQDPRIYARRGSGVIQEAIAGGRPFIHRLGSALPRHDVAAAISVTSADDVADAVQRIVNEAATWFARAAVAAERLEFRARSNDLATACRSRGVAVENPAVALVIGAWRPGGGSARLMALQCQTLAALGFQVVRVHMARQGLNPLEILASALSGPHRDRDVVLSFVIEAATSSSQEWEWAATPRLLLRLFEQKRVRLVVGNFPQSGAWIGSLPGAEHCTRIIETHDPELRPDLGDIDVRAKVTPWFDAAIFVSATECEAWRAAGQPSCVTILPPLDDRDGEPHPAIEEIHDLIFVGSGHQRNKRSLSRLLDDILDHTDMAGVSLLVVGSVSEPGGLSHPNAIAIGHTDDLESAYASARVVVAPYGGDGGIPSKVLGALCRGKPLVADAAAVALLNDSGDFAVEDVEAFRLRIRELLDSAPRRRRAAADSRRAWARLAAPQRYVTDWRKLLESLGVTGATVSRRTQKRV